MDHACKLAVRRKPVNVSLPLGLVSEAKAAGLNISSVAEAALSVAVKEVQLAQWAKDNSAGLAALNQLIEEEGLPLDEHRLF